MEAYSWDNRVNFVVKHMYDIDNNGYLDQRDFEAIAVRTCVMEGKGDCSIGRLGQYQHIMRCLWEEISELADYDNDGKITTEEFKLAVQQSCIGKKYEAFPQSLKAFIEANFKMMDMDGDGIVSIEEFRYNVVSRTAVDNIDQVDSAFNHLLDDDDRRRGGLTLSRYQELYGQYLGNPDSNNNCAIYLFGPLALKDN